MSNETYLFVDVESTGLDPKHAELIEFGAVAYQNQKKIAEIELKIEPFRENYSLGAFEVNRLSPKEFENFTNPLEAAHEIAEFLVDLPKAYRGSLLFCGHNVSFDFGFVNEFMRKAGYQDFSSYIGRKIDTFSIAKFLIDSGTLVADKPGLASVATALKLDYDSNKHHSALYDAKLSAKAYFSMMDLVKGQKGLKKSFTK